MKEETVKTYRVCGEQHGCMDIAVRDASVTLSANGSTIQISRSEWESLKARIVTKEIE